MAKTEFDAEQTLQTCLELIRQGQETIDSVLARYPEWVDDLRPGLEAAIWLDQRNDVFEPRPGFVAASRRRIVARIRDESTQASPAHPKRGLLSHLGKFVAWEGRLVQHKFAFRLVSVLILILSLLFGSSSAALASQDSLPGDPLYPMKLAIERVELVVTPGAAADAELQIHYTRKRLIEIQSLILEGRYEAVPTGVSYLESQVNQAVGAVSRVADLDENQAEELSSSLQETLSSQSMMMTILSGAAPPTSRNQFERIEQITATGISAAQGVVGQTTPTPTLTNTPAATPTPVETPTPSGSITAPGQQKTKTPVEKTPKPEQTKKPSPDVTIQADERPGSITPTPRPTNPNRPTSQPKATKEPKPTKDK